MKAVYIIEFGGRDKLIFTKEFPKPIVQEGEVLVRIKAASVNPVDFKIRDGLRKNLPHNFPMVLGWDMAGIIEERGFGARRFNVGDEIFSYARRPIVDKGTYAEYISIPECYVAKKPKSLNFEEASTIPLTGLTAYQAIHDKAKIRKGESILILGASGGVGSMAVQLSKVAGAYVIAIASNENGDYLRSLGADSIISYDKNNWAETFKILFPDKADVVFDCVGKETLVDALECVKPGGRLVSIAGQVDNELAKSLNIKFIYHFVEPNVVELDYLASLIDNGKLKTHISKIYPLEEAIKAHEQIESGHTRGKIVLSIS
jgi:NADPH:quinone reductase-like Zn-dependent oxidoreductase